MDYRQGDKNVIWRLRTWGGKEGTLWYLNSLVEVTKQTEYCFMGEELTRVVEELNQVTLKS